MFLRNHLFLGILLCFGLVACDRPAPEPQPTPAAQPEAAVESAVEEVVEEVAEPEAPDEDRVTILVTGATGTQGGAVARELLKRGYQVRGLTRDTQSEKSQALAALGVEMVQGDYDDVDSITAALDGAAGLFAVTLFWHGGYDAEVAQGKMLVDEALKAGIGHLVLTSVAGADAKSGIPHFESKWEVEKYLHKAALNWTIIRPVEFMDNWGWSTDDFSQGRLVDPRQLESSHQWIAASDIGFFVGEAFEKPVDWIGVTQEIAGDQLTLGELQADLAEAYGQDFTHIQPTWEDFEAEIGEEITQMYRWFENKGYAVDIEGLREQYPNLVTVPEFLAEMAASSSD